MLREIIKLRADPELKAGLTAAALARGVTVSQLVREQLRAVARPASSSRVAA